MLPQPVPIPVARSKVINMGEAIARKDLVRIRSGSPGIRHGTSKIELGNGKTFANEMKDQGIAEDINQISRFNYVLMSRSTAQFETT